MPNNDMGKAENITNMKFDAAAKAMDMTVEEAKQNALELLEKVLPYTQSHRHLLEHMRNPGAKEAT
jgi:hypothetical protein